MRRTTFSSSRTLPGHGYSVRWDEGLRRKLLLLSIAGVEASQERGGHRQDLLPPFPQRRDAQFHDLDAVIEVFVELAIDHRALEVAVGDGDHPGVDRDRVVTANPGGR